MTINPTEISDIIKDKIKNLDIETQSHNEGTVVSLTDGIARIYGITDALQGEMLEFPNNIYGLALNLERDSVGAVILGDYKSISEGDTVKCTGNILEVPVGNELLGRDAGKEGLDWWGGDLDRGQTEQQVIDNIKRSDEYKNREMAKDLAMSMEGKSYGKDDATYTSGYTDAFGDFEDTSNGQIGLTVMKDYYNPTTGQYTQVGAHNTPKAGTGWVENPNSFNADGEGGWLYGDPNNPKGTSKINENSLDAWVGPGGALTQSSDESGKGYYAGIDATKAAEIAAPSSGFTDKLDDRDQKIYDLYTNVFGRNPDESGFQYWTSGDQDKMSLADIEASFKGSAEAKLRDNISGTDKPIYQSVDDYLAGKTSGMGSGGETDDIPLGSNNASTGQSPQQSLAGDTDPAMLGQIAKQMGLDPEMIPIMPTPGPEPDPVTKLYKDLLGRTPDAEGMKYWGDQLKSGNQTYDQVADNIMRSEEYQQRKGRTSPPPRPPAPDIGDPGPREPEIRRPTRVDLLC